MSVSLLALIIFIQSKKTYTGLHLEIKLLYVPEGELELQAMVSYPLKSCEYFLYLFTHADSLTIRDLARVKKTQATLRTRKGKGLQASARH